MKRPAVFLDRDGTLIEERGFIDSSDRMALFPWTVDAIRLLNRAGFATVVVTNQSGIARGLFDEAFLRGLHAELDRTLVAGDARIDGYYYCPHLPDAPVEAYRQVCRCRKPAPGLIEQAAADLDLDLAGSVTVGDRWRDVLSGQAAGIRSVLVRTGYGAQESRQPPAEARPDAILNHLMEAVSWILRS